VHCGDLYGFYNTPARFLGSHTFSRIKKSSRPRTGFALCRRAEITAPAPALPEYRNLPEPVYEEPPAPSGLSAAFGMRKKHQAAIEQAWTLGPGIVIDLSEATFFDSTILMVIMQALRRAEASDMEKLALVVPLRSHANRVLVLSGFTQLLMPIAESRDEVFQAWEPSAS